MGERGDGDRNDKHGIKVEKEKAGEGGESKQRGTAQREYTDDTNVGPREAGFSSRNSRFDDMLAWQQTAYFSSFASPRRIRGCCCGLWAPSCSQRENFQGTRSLCAARALRDTDTESVIYTRQGWMEQTCLVELEPHTLL